MRIAPRCSTRRSSRHCAPNTRAPRKPRSPRRNSASRCRWCSAALIAARCPMPGFRPCSTRPIGRMRAALPDFAGLDVALVGVPMDLGVTNRAGARFGPRAVRDVERIGPYNHALGVTPSGECHVADIGDVPLRSRYSLDNSIEDIAVVLRAHPGRRGAAGLGRRRPFGHLPDPEGARRRAAGRPGPYRRPLRHDGPDRRLEIPPWRPVPPGGAGRRARPRAHDPDRHPRPGRDLLGVLLRVRA